MLASSQNRRAFSFSHPKIYISICFLSTSTLSLCSSQFLKSKLKWRKHCNGLFRWLQVLQSMFNRSSNWFFLNFLLLLMLAFETKRSNIFWPNLLLPLKMHFHHLSFFSLALPNRVHQGFGWVGEWANTGLVILILLAFF